MKSREIIEWSKTIAGNDINFINFIKQKETELNKIHSKRKTTIIITIMMFCFLLILNGFLKSKK
jgi:preprotein translocase subunit SecE